MHLRVRLAAVLAENAVVTAAVAEEKAVEEDALKAGAAEPGAAAEEETDNI